MTLRIGTRGSDLALWQARHVAGLLERAGERCELVVLVTRGDRIDDVPLQNVEGKGFFTSELEEALRARRIDLAVHSHKDLPGQGPPDLVIAAIPPRASPAERLLLARAAHDPRAPFLPLARGARVGTSAPRREAQLALLRPDLLLAPLRGNVPTRVRRLREGRHDAILLAAAGLDRLALALDDLVVVELPLALLVPAPAQGALAVQTRAADRELVLRLARVLHDPATAEAVGVERGLLTALGGGCNLPLGAVVTRAGHGTRIDAFLGAGHPHADAPARWVCAHGATPAEAASAAHEALLHGTRAPAGPLAGRRVALTGSAKSARELEERLRTLGACVVREVVLTHEDLPAPELGARLAALRAGDALVVTSARAARRLAGLRPPRAVLVAAVGPATRQALESAGIPVDVTGTSGAEALARELPLARGTRVLFPCAEEARPELAEALRAREVELERLLLYRVLPVPAARLDAGAEVRLYASPSAVDACLAAERAQRPGAARVALGPSTAAALSAAGLPHSLAPGTASEEVLSALLAALAPPENVR